MKRFAAALAALLFAIWHSTASACGAFAAVKTPDLEKTLPYLAIEQALVLWDSETQEEDFVREARFERANQAFGFVVPTPSKPAVSGVKVSPFARLRERFPYEDALGMGGGAAGSGKGGGGGEKTGAPAVVVLSEQRIGSFTAFTLSASDAGAFDRWLAENGFEMTAEAKPWLEHYVRLHFFFVAFRYEPSSGAPGTTEGMTSETVRIHFKTPNPYYPYLEPAHPAGAASQDSRLLLGWIVTRKPMMPVAAKANDHTRWVRPWNYGYRQDAASSEVASVVGADLGALIPTAKELVVQPFRDTKISREGYGDVVLVPGLPITPTPAELEARRALLGAIDPVLLGEADAGPAPAATTTPSPPPKRGGCAMTPGGGASGGLFAVAAVLACVARRARKLALATLLVGCKPQGTAGVEAGVIEAEAAAPVSREQAAFDVLAGNIPAEGIPTDPDVPAGVPRADVSMGAVTLEGGKVPDADKTLAAGMRPKVRMCWQANAIRLEHPPHGTSTLLFHFVIGANGEVKSAEDPVVEPAGRNLPPQFLSCTRRALTALSFTPPYAVVKAAVTITIRT